MDKHWSLILRLVGLLIFLSALFFFLHSILWVIGLLLVGMLIVYILYPLLQYLKDRFRIHHGLATVLVFIVFLLLCLLALSLLVPLIYFESLELIESFPHYLSRVQIGLSWISQQTVRFEIQDELRSYLLGLSDSLHLALEYLAEASLSLISGTVDFFLVLFLVFFLLYDWQSIRAELVDIVPSARKQLVRELILIVDTSIGAFIRGSLVRCLIVGFLIGVALFAIGMPYALLLGLIAGIFNFILFIGPYIAAVPAVLLSLSPLTPAPWLVILVYVAIQIVDGLFLAPAVLGRVVRLKPITIITAILAGGKMAGVLGMVFAVPVAGIIKGIIELVKRNRDAQDNDNGCNDAK